MFARGDHSDPPGDLGITGLETAVVLITFVLASTVFAATVIQAGLFSSGKSKEAIGEGLKASVSAMSVIGHVVAVDHDGDKVLDEVQIPLAGVLGEGAVIDLGFTLDSNGDGLLSDEPSKVHSTMVSFSDEHRSISDIAWTVSGMGRDDGDSLLEEGEQYRLDVSLVAISSQPLAPWQRFTIEILPAGGRPLVISRTVPALFSKYMQLN